VLSVTQQTTMYKCDWLIREIMSCGMQFSTMPNRDTVRNIKCLTIH